MRSTAALSLGLVIGLVIAAGFGFAFSRPAAVAVPVETTARPAAAAPTVKLDSAEHLAAGGAPVQPEKPLRIIAFGAHPDDCEIRTGGTAILWSQQGHQVKFVSVTNGDIGHWRQAGGPLAQRRYEEVQRAARILGVTTEVLDIHDGELVPTLENRRTVTRLIRQWNADIVMSHRPNDYHPDHRYTGVLVQDSAYMVAVPFICPDVPHLTGNPVFLFYWDRFEQPNPFAPDVVVSIDAVIEQKLDALGTMHSQFYEGGALGYTLPDLPPPGDDSDAARARHQQVRSGFRSRFADVADKYRAKLVELYGPEAGARVNYAEAFEVCEYGRQPTAGELRRLFPVAPAN